MDVSAITVPTLAEEVYDRVRSGITSGTLAPGSRVSIRALADQLSVSTMPVREALKRLQAEGFVVFGRRSVSVVSLTAEELHQVFAVRLHLEQLATEWALPRLTPTDVDDLRAVLAEMADDHLETGRWRALNRRFHQRFYECAASPYLLDLIRGVWDRVEPYMAIYASTVEDFSEAHRQHVRMLGLIETGDLPGLLAENDWHLEHTRRTVAEALSEARRPPT
ncbi:GntR family transcriptional regulator [Kineococcus rhizosphaerae]|uniref:GntR family transcriptional regulator n=1 Tax=Kineococcus rhizosphaerae TaxID=559628 RepID=A0A2T0R3M3_9ACTN|nr:GntR family transcriptional regulator [Kineococcus rhizosphaerae]PRY14644.1 GntR family transcriptional regulator [Kineococcus rhizosphaerae]